MVFGHSAASIFRKAAHRIHYARNLSAPLPENLTAAFDPLRTFGATNVAQ